MFNYEKSPRIKYPPETRPMPQTHSQQLEDRSSRLSPTELKNVEKNTVIKTFLPKKDAPEMQLKYIRPTLNESLQPDPLNTHVTRRAEKIESRPTPSQAVQTEERHFRPITKFSPYQLILVVGPIFFIGGLNLAWTIRFDSKSEVGDILLNIWLIGTIIGAICGALITYRVKTKLLWFIASTMVIISGTIFFTQSMDNDLINFFRFMNGIVYGVMFVTAIILIGEETSKFRRGVVISILDTLFFNVGLILQINISYLWVFDSYTIINMEQIHGILCIIAGLVAAVLTFLYVIESPVYYFVHGRNRVIEANTALYDLKYPFTGAPQNDLTELKSYAMVNKRFRKSQILLFLLPALFKLCFYRVLVAVTFSKIYIESLKEAAPIPLLKCGSAQNCVKAEFKYYIPMLACVFPRIFGGLIAAALVEPLGRKPLMIAGALGLGIVALTIKGVFENSTHFFFITEMKAAMYLLLIYQFCAGLFIPVSSVYLAEAFPVIVKPYFIAVVFILEMVVQIWIIELVHDTVKHFKVVGILCFLFVVIAILTFPETKGHTLRSAQMQFRRIIGANFI